MAYDDDILLNQGAVKASEIFMDRANNLVGSSVGSSGVRVIEKSLDTISTLLSKQSLVLTSTGRIEWKSTALSAEIVFDKDTAFVPATDIVVYILQNENGSSQKTYKVTIQGASAASPTHFKTITINNNELIYIEIKKSELLASGGNLIITNGIDYIGTEGKRLKKTLVDPATQGMDQLLNPISLLNETPSGTDTTMYIPLALRVDFQLTSGVIEKNIWWVPHGIRWPSGTTSTIGAVIVDGSQVYPNYFVAANENTLAQAISTINGTASGGGVILIWGDITLTSAYTIPANVILMGRGFVNHTVTLGAGGSITLGNYCRLQDLKIVMSSNGYVQTANFCEISGVNFYGNSNFGTIGNESMLKIQGSNNIVKSCQFNWANTTSLNAFGINIVGNENRIRDCKFLGVASSAFKTGVRYFSGSGNTDTDTYAT
jgi:uncharacterized protein YaiE (UPF0345 family)